MLSDPVFDQFINSFEAGRTAGAKLASKVLRPPFGRQSISAKQAWLDGFAVGRIDASAADRRISHTKRPQLSFAG